MEVSHLPSFLATTASSSPAVASSAEAMASSTPVAATATVRDPSQNVLEAVLVNMALGGFTLQPTGDTGVYSEDTLHHRSKNAPRYSTSFPLEVHSGLKKKSFNSVRSCYRQRAQAQGAHRYCSRHSLYRSLHHLRIPQSLRTSRKLEVWSGCYHYSCVHDVIIPFGVFGVLVHFYGAEIDILFTTALLAILGISISDTIVVFDRIRENLRLNREGKSKKPFDVVVRKPQADLRTLIQH